MRNELKRLFGLMSAAIIILTTLTTYLLIELEETNARAEALAAQVYSLGSMLGERQAADRAESTISEVTYFD